METGNTARHTPRSDEIPERTFDEAAERVLRSSKNNQNRRGERRGERENQHAQETHTRRQEKSNARLSRRARARAPSFCDGLPRVRTAQLLFPFPQIPNPRSLRDSRAASRTPTTRDRTTGTYSYEFCCGFREIAL